jgi:hypothetical protein
LTPPNEPDQRFGTNTGAYFAIRDNNASFERFGAGRLNESFTLSVPGDPTAPWIPAQWFSADLMATIGVEPLPGDWPPTDPNGIAISYGLWRRLFGRAPNVLERTVEPRSCDRAHRGRHAGRLSGAESGHGRLVVSS